MMHQNADYTVSEWDGTERRGVDGVALQLMVEVRKAMDKHEEDEKKVFTEIKDLIKEKDEASQERHAELSGRFDAMQQSTSSLLFENNRTTTEIHKLFKAAFPEGDAAAHRKAHESWIEKDKAEKEFWLKIKTDAIKTVVVGVMIWAGMVLWAAFLKGPGA